MILKKSWFYIIVYVGIFSAFMYLNNLIIRQPTMSWHIFLISMTLMIMTSVIAVILSFREKKACKKKSRIVSSFCFILSICLTIFASGWLGLILLIQYGN